ncbi:MAG: hypothetical protein CPSOU_1858 [uncultured Paraburkholderia sp.]|nr:MAG: hypothetical protein CPSOU_1858 [uncultured Paraburkholderia sp.]
MEFTFEYTRQRGNKHTYHVTAHLMKHVESGVFAYSAVVHRGSNYAGPLALWPLNASDPDAAMLEAKNLIERDIEDLVGIDE